MKQRKHGAEPPAIPSWRAKTPSSPHVLQRLGADDVHLTSYHRPAIYDDTPIDSLCTIIHRRVKTIDLTVRQRQQSFSIRLILGGQIEQAAPDTSSLHTSYQHHYPDERRSRRQRGQAKQQRKAGSARRSRRRKGRSIPSFSQTHRLTPPP